jgi:hypothetical protein
MCILQIEIQREGKERYLEDENDWTKGRDREKNMNINQSYNIDCYQYLCIRIDKDHT